MEGEEGQAACLHSQKCFRLLNSQVCTDGEQVVLAEEWGRKAWRVTSQGLGVSLKGDHTF